MGIPQPISTFTPLGELLESYHYTSRTVEIGSTVYSKTDFPVLSFIFYISALRCYNKKQLIDFLKSISINDNRYIHVYQKVCEVSIDEIKINSFSYFELIGDEYILSHYIQKKQ